MSSILQKTIPFGEDSPLDLRTNPGIPYKQQLIEIPKNLPPNTGYCVGQTGLDPTEGINTNMLTIKGMMNNITEILAYSVLHQNLGIIENFERDFNNVQRNLLLIIKNQEDLKSEVNQIKNLVSKNDSTSSTSSSSSIIQSIILAKPKDSSETSRFTKPLF